jgi:hypothetical protein
MRVGRKKQSDMGNFIDSAPFDGQQTKSHNVYLTGIQPQWQLASIRNACSPFQKSKHSGRQFHFWFFSHHVLSHQSSISPRPKSHIRL